MYGVFIEKGPKEWQIIQQQNGFADILLEGRVELPEEEWNRADNHRIIIKVNDEATNARVITPTVIKLEGKRTFSVTLKIPAGGPYKIETEIGYFEAWRKRGDRIMHVGVGDVFVIAGQSNASGTSSDIVCDPLDLSVHAFKLRGEWDIASHPIADGTGSIFPPIDEGAVAGHSPWIAFGKILSKELGYPIGLIPAALGGSPLSYWNRKESGHLFNNMLKMIEMSGSSVCGMLWYQGCTDAEDEAKRSTYFERFKYFCEDVRKELGKDLPIFTVQLNKFTGIKDLDTTKAGKNYCVIRDAQTKAAKEIENVYMIPTVDLKTCDGAHNTASSNLVIAQRIANQALRYVYKKDTLCDAPEISKVIKTDSKTVRMYFKNVYDLIYGDSNRTEALMFSLTDSKGRILPSDYEIPCDDSIVLKFDRDIADNATVSCDQYNESGLMPYDRMTFLPIVPFSNAVVE